MQQLEDEADTCEGKSLENYREAGLKPWCTIPLNSCIRREERLKISDLIVHLKKLGKKQKTNLKPK